MLSWSQKLLKRVFDVILSLILLLILISPIFLLIIISSLDTKGFGVFNQKRIGLKCKSFYIYKIRTIRGIDTQAVYISPNSKNISQFGNFLRDSHLDELPQLFNILLGTMSFVGPRPDVVGFADVLPQKDQLFLQAKPGITSPASIKYRNENKLLSQQKNPEEYYKNILWPDKVKMNNDYVKNWSFLGDIKLILLTIFS